MRQVNCQCLPTKREYHCKSVGAIKKHTSRRRAAGRRAAAEEVDNPRSHAEAPQQRGGLRGADPRPRALDPASQLLASRPEA